ncbi:hypothetical protein ACFHYQ_15540 [Sphaerimonospora cavernae]|uniref:Uncharacterized protein n=1 Tax=Sphaerimonospora cavernae TaxID=1740611 RepID=A0ABV6U5I8_9ACTN
MIKRSVLIGAVVAAGATLTLLPSGPASAQAGASAAAPAPAKTAGALFNAWQRGDRAAAARHALPAAVKTLFAYPYRAPDEFAGCVRNACRFVHTSVRVPGGLNGVLMIVSGSKVAKVYTSRHLSAPSAAAKGLFTAWKRHDRDAGLEVAATKAVATLFRARYDVHGVRYYYQGCSAEPKGYSCAWSYEGGAMLMHVRGSKAAGYQVASIGHIAD